MSWIADVVSIGVIAIFCAMGLYTYFENMDDE